MPLNKETNPISFLLCIAINFFYLLVYLCDFLPWPFQEWRRISYKGTDPVFILFGEISAAELRF